jgi:aryl-alcohol dehydrogenase-like predicted oxidoreductase
VQTRKIGKEKVSAIGLGAMPLSIEGRPTEDRAIRTIHAALDAGITLIDTADSYCLNPDEHGHNELLVAKALAGHRDRNRVLVATKGGHLRPGDGSWSRNGDPEYLKQACEASLQRLGVDAIGLYQFHRPDPAVPFVESVGALVDLQAEGKIRMIGVSNVNIDQIRQSLNFGAVSVQNQFSPRFRSSEGELVFSGEHRLAFLAYSPLGGIRSAALLGERHRAFADVASEHRVSAQQVALAWMLAKGNHVIPIPGSSRPETVLDSAAAVDLKLTGDDMKRLDRL